MIDLNSFFSITNIIFAIILVALGAMLGRWLLEQAALKGAYTRPRIVSTVLVIVAVAAVYLYLQGLGSLLAVALWLVIGMVIGAAMRGQRRSY